MVGALAGIPIAISAVSAAKEFWRDRKDLDGSADWENGAVGDVRTGPELLESLLELLELPGMP